MYTHTLTGPTESLEWLEPFMGFLLEKSWEMESEFEDAKRPTAGSWDSGARGVQRSSFLNFYFFIF